MTEKEDFPGSHPLPTPILPLVTPAVCSVPESGQLSPASHKQVDAPSQGWEGLYMCDTWLIPDVLQRGNLLANVRSTVSRVAAAYGPISLEEFLNTLKDWIKGI